MSKKVKKFSKPRFWLKFVQLVSLLVFCLAVYVGYQITRPLNIPNSKTYLFEPGENIADFAQELKQDDFIDSTQLVIWTARLGNIDRMFKAGEYRFDPEYNLLAVLNHIVEGKSITYSIQFIEGWTFNDYLNELNMKNNLDKTLSDVSYENVLETLQIPQQHPEGWFFPDTYNYTSGQSDAAILHNAYDAMQKLLYSEWSKRSPDLPYKTAYEGLIVASIIQKESGDISEYPIIAGVIVNRLNRGMRLQMDPTVIYGLGGIEGPLINSHLKKDTVYNTYTRRGLPPTPISMPGLEALKAAANPADTDALYFVSRGDGTHKFSDTLEEHLVAVREYRKKTNQ